MTHETLKKPGSNDSLNLLLTNAIKYGPKISHNRPLVKMSVALAEKWFVDHGEYRLKTENKPAGVIKDQTAFCLAMLNSANRAILECKLSEATYREASRILMRDALIEQSPRKAVTDKFREKYGYNSPTFLVISPSRACNLHCTGCYADSDEQVQSLEWDVVDRIVSEAHDLWGAQFIVISGGEPLAYRSQGKSILDLAEKHPDSYFMMYTNSTLITNEVAERMAKCGNIIPAISLEGWRERTDARRGAGVFDRVMEAMDRLYEAGVIYGVSLTATRENVDEILSEEFIDFLFTQKHVLFGWLFQYMPIGRSYTLDLMPTPQQRAWMWEQGWRLIREKKVFLADFWNHGTVVDGCLSGGGHGVGGGYLYIEWNGNVTPCVFVPYSPVNIKDIYAGGGTLNDAFAAPFFAGIRQWQAGLKSGRLLNPCLIRDHNPVLRQLVSTHGAHPIDANAQAALQDQQYGGGLDVYGQSYAQITDKIWQESYLNKSQVTPLPEKG
ncbi:MAG: radical SAM protein [Anaerolineae bacterium]|nr:radical SAM protein [Anaerolineae bacterium]